MCVIGWIKTKNGFIMFKNRDFIKSYRPRNRLFLKNNVIGLQFKNYWGYSSGINTSGVCIVVAGVEFDNMIKKRPIRMWPLCKKTLENFKTAKKAKNFIIKEFYKQNPTTGGNTIIADSKDCFIIENVKKEIKCELCKGFVVRSNHFISMEEKYPLSAKDNDTLSSLKRYETAYKFLKKNKITRPKQLYPILKNHKPKKGNLSVCRHGKIKRTFGGIIYYFREGKIEIHTSWNKNPCEQDFEIIEIIPK